MNTLKTVAGTAFLVACLVGPYALMEDEPAADFVVVELAQEVGK